MPRPSNQLSGRKGPGGFFLQLAMSCSSRIVLAVGCLPPTPCSSGNSELYSGWEYSPADGSWCRMGPAVLSLSHTPCADGVGPGLCKAQEADAHMASAGDRLSALGMGS